MKKITLLLIFALTCVFSSQSNAQSFSNQISNYLAHLSEQNILLEDDANFKITNTNTSSASNIQHVYFVQAIDDIEIYGTQSSIHILADGSPLQRHNKFIKDHSTKIKGNRNASLTAIQAVTAAANQLNYSISEAISVIENSRSVNKKVLLSEGGMSLSPIPAKLVYHITDSEELVLAWDISIQEKSQHDWWSIRIDANTGNILDKNNWMVSCSFEHDHSIHEELDYNANLFDIPNYNELVENSGGCTSCYEVFDMPLESPYYGNRSIETGNEDPTASPFGWHDTNGSPGAEFTVTRGNNVDAYEDGNNQGYQPDGGSDLNFTGYPFSQNYTNGNQYEDAAITNLFYWNNIIHDVMYTYGFDEASGNFQENNYGNGGAGSDSVNAEAQDGSGTCNANFGTPNDGGNPTMQMYVCGNKDGDFDNLVIIHEYGHGISNRLTGGPGNSGCLSNSEQMGEGWSDFYGYMMTFEPGDTGTDSRGVGTYLFNQGIGGAGIRNYKYSTDMAVNPQTYADIASTGSSPHALGEIWAEMLWELNWALVDDHGFDADIYNFTGDPNLDAGNVVTMAIVTEGMRLQPCSPGFVDGRDAILAADQAIYGGAHECTIWDAFAKRGLGVSASQGSSSSRTDGTEAFDTPSGVAAYTAPADVCVTTPVLTGLGGGTPTGGEYSGPGVTDDGNGITYTFDPAAAGAGIHTISYEVEATSCSTASVATDDIEVLSVPPGPTTTGAADFCVGEEVTVTATLNDNNNVIRWYDAATGGNFIYEGESYTFTPTGSINLYAQESTSTPLSRLVVSEITLETPDQLEIQNVGAAFDYTGYSVALSADPYPDVNAMNTIVQILGPMDADSVMNWNDSGGSEYWGNNIYWDNGGTGWIIIVDDTGNVVDSIFWNFTAAEISNLNVMINGFNITAADLDWTGNGATLTIDCNSSFRRVGDTNTAADWTGICEASDYGVANSDIDLDAGGCPGERTLTEVTADLILPTITCSTNIEISADNDSCEATNVALIDPVTNDNCGIQSLTNNAPTSYSIGDTEVIWTVTDTAGNTATCTQTITVVDDITPIITCAGDMEISADEANCSASGVTLDPPTVIENCTVQSLANDAPTTFPIGSTLVTWTVIDSSGNTATCEQTITVIDNIAPIITCSENIVVYVDEDQCAASGIVLLEPEIIDNCGIQSISNNAPTNYPLGVTNVTWTITDDAGNVSTCIQVVTVLDDIDPEITCPADLTVTVNEGELFSLPDYTGDAIATDNCTTDPIISQDPSVGTEIGPGITVITMTATDDSGNEVTCTFDITVDEILSVEDATFANNIVLYPNPTQQDIVLVNNSSKQLVSGTIVDVSGRIIETIDFTSSGIETNLSVSNYATGVYFIRIYSESNSIIKRFVKK